MNINKLRGKMVEQGIRTRDVAKAMHISVQALNKKFRGDTKITVDDIDAISSVVKFKSSQEKAEIFLT